MAYLLGNGVLPLLYANRLHIRGIFNNLIANAIRAIQEVERENGIITISTTTIEKRDFLHIRIIISDNGKGIKAKDKDKIFERYFTKSKEGMGIGLHATKVMLEYYDAYITVDSFPEKGSTFIVDISPEIQ